MVYRRGPIGPLALIVIGALLLLRNLGHLPASLDRWWPVILILVGLWILFIKSTAVEPMPAPPGSSPPPSSEAASSERRRHASTGGLVLVALGAALLVSNLLGGRSVGALTMIAIGLALLIGRIW